MSVNRKTLSLKRLSGKRKKTPVEMGQEEVLIKLGLESSWIAPLDRAAMLDISTWSLENQPPLVAKNLPRAFLRRLWLLCPQARNPCCQAPPESPTDTPETEALPGQGETEDSPVNPLDLVMAVYISASSLLQQEMTVRMAQCQFALPLVLPFMGLVPEPKPFFLLWPLRDVVGQWRSDSSLGEKLLQEGDLASTEMPLVSCVKLGHCGVSKSLVLSHLVGGPRGQSEAFLHRGMTGGQQPRKLANGLVEVGWVLPTGDLSLDVFPEPLVVANLRGDATAHETQACFLCRVSSVVVVFCGDLGLKERQLLASWKGVAKQIILIDLVDPVEVQAGVIADNGSACKTLGVELGRPEGTVLSGRGANEEELAYKLREALNNLLPDGLKRTTLEAASMVAQELGVGVDEGVVCRKALALVEDVLRGLEDEGATQYREKQLPLQGPLWRRLAELEEEASRQKGSGVDVDQQLQTEKQDLQKTLGSYKMTAAMQVFTDTLASADKLERTYFLNWMKLRLKAKQRTQHPLWPNQEVVVNGTHEEQNYDYDDSFETDSEEEVEQEEEMQLENGFSEAQEVNENAEENGLAGGVEVSGNGQEVKMEGSENGLKVEPSMKARHKVNFSENQNMDKKPELTSFSLSLEHFLREMGLIFELTHSSPGRRTHNALRLPSVAADLLLYGVPLEILDGDAFNMPRCWLSCVLAELNRRLNHNGARVRTLTSLGVQDASSAEVFSAVFGVNFPQRSRGLQCTRGVYLLGLSLPDNLKKDMDCDFLLIIDMQGLCAPGLAEEADTLVHDNKMATFMTSLSDVVLLNLPPEVCGGKQPSLAVMVNALLRTRRSGTMPVPQLLTQGVDIDTRLQTLQLSRVIQILETEAKEKGDPPVPEKHQEQDNNNKNKHQNGKMNRPPVLLIGPWQNSSLSTPVDKGYGPSVLQLKQSLFQALVKSSTQCKASSLPEFMTRVCTVWDGVKGQNLGIPFGDKEVAEAFCLLCTELSQWEGPLQEHMEVWFSGAQQRILACKSSALERGEMGDPLGVLKEEARSEVKSEVDKIRTRLDQHMKKDDLHRDYIYAYKDSFNMDPLQEQVTNKMIDRLESAKENHYSTTQLTSFQTIMEVEQEAKLHSLAGSCKSDNNLLQDKQLEEEFEGIWTKAVSNFDFRPSEKEDITTRVTELLRKNLTSRGLHKHLKKLEVIGPEKPGTFIVYDEHFGYRSRLKHMFEDNNMMQRTEAHRLASTVIEEYNEFVAVKKLLLSDFSDSYITEVLEKVERALKSKAMEIRSAFEVDLKVYLCHHACQDFQNIHDRYAKDRDLLGFLNSQKDRYLGEFIYKFRKRDQAQRVARAFTDMVFRPAALDYVHRPLGKLVLEEMVSEDDGKQYSCPEAFNLCLLEELLEEDRFESFVEYLLSYDSFCLKRLQTRVQAHLAGSSILEESWQQRLGEVVGKMASAVSQTSEVTGGGLSNTGLLLKKVCLTLEADGEVEVSRDVLQGPVFHITTHWDRFVTCLMEALAEMRLALSRQFSQTTEYSQVLQALPIQPQDSLLVQVRGCQKQCPFCRAPCEMGRGEHSVHSTSLHRPTGLVSNTVNGSSCLSHNTCPCDMTGENLFLDEDTHRQSQPQKELHSIHPEWSIPAGQLGCQATSHRTYWRYVLVRFNNRFAEEYKCEPARLPQGWEEISQQGALESLRENCHSV